MRHCIHQWLIQQCQMGPLPRSDTPLQPTCTLGRCQASMMCCQSYVARFLSEDHWISHPYKTQYQCSYVAIWGTVSANDWYSRPDGTITKVWQAFTTNMYTREVSGINDVLPKLGLDFCQQRIVIGFLTLTRLNICAACCNEALYPPMIDTAGQMGPLPIRSDNPLQPTCTLGRCQASMMCCQSCG